MARAKKAEASPVVMDEVATPVVAPQITKEKTEQTIEKPTPSHRPKRYVTDTGLTIEDY